MEKAIGVSSEVDHGRILCSLRKIQDLPMLTEKEKFDNILGLWVRMIRRAFILNYNVKTKTSHLV